MSRLFEASSINGMRLPNRFVRSATWAGMATDNGECTPQLIELMTRLADGGAGLIITGHAYVHVQGRHQPYQLGVDRDALIPGLQRLTNAVQNKGGRIALQLGYGGTYLSKSRVRHFQGDDFSHICDCFSRAAKRTQTAGFDAIQILAAHGFLLSQMLCPRYNDREDSYGGALENRARLVIEVVEAVRHAVGTDYPVLVKLNCQDFVENGLTLPDAVQVGKMLEKAGIDAIEISGGLLNIARLLDSKIESEDDEAYFKKEASVFKKNLRVPLVLVGGIRTYGVSETLIKDGITDYVAMCRPFICEPDLINRWKAGDHQRAACISCNNCIEEAKAGQGVACVPLAQETSNFFPQGSVNIPASLPHPPQSSYQVSIGLAEISGVFCQMVKILMEIDGHVDEKQAPIYPADTDDYQRVSRAISKLIAQYGKDPNPSL